MEHITAAQMKGKTVKSVRDGLEELRIEFEDGSVYTQYTYSGDPRDI